ncbi:MAG TPA: class I SAM-dependent methyltransferase [Mycobacteriales bacterium]|nr:class I SAM-dependent methyltransferase [Mycobacteriales bacterium]
MPFTRIIAAKGVAEYRATIESTVEPGDIVLEIGCEWGTTTEVIAERARHVIGADISTKCIERAQKMRPALDFRVLDGFDVMAVRALDPPADVIYLDLSGLSGYRGLLDLIALLNTYAAVLRPRVVVVKSGGLKQFLEHCRAWHDQEHRPMSPHVAAGPGRSSR